MHLSNMHPVMSESHGSLTSLDAILPHQAVLLEAEKIPAIVFRANILTEAQPARGNNQVGIFEAEGNKSLIPGRLVRSPLTCPSTRKVRDESIVSLCSERCNVSTGSPWLTVPAVRNGLIDFFPGTCNCQLADSPGGYM